MVLIQRSGILVVLAVGLVGCSQSLFDSTRNGGGNGSGSGSDMVPAACPAPCLADAAADFDGTDGGAGNKWRYLEDHRDHTWTAMTADARTRKGADPANAIASCADQRDAAACQVLPGALLFSASGATGAADPAIELSSTAARVIVLSVRAFVAAGDEQTIRIYRNSREDLLFTGSAFAGTLLEQAVTVDALAGDRFLVALTPKAAGATDVALELFASATGDAFPKDCQAAASFAAATGNTVDDLCGSELTHKLFSFDNGPTPTPPVLAAGPFTEHGSAADFTVDNYYTIASTIDKSHDTTVQFWAKYRGPLDEEAWMYSDLDLDAKTDTIKGGGLAIGITLDGELALDTCTDATETTIMIDRKTAAWPTDAGWHFVRVVHSASNVYVCLDGVRKTSFNVGVGLLQSRYAPTLGINEIWTPRGGYFNGELDDVRVFTGALPCN